MKRGFLLVAFSILIGLAVPEVSRGAISSCEELGSLYSSTSCTNNLCGTNPCLCGTAPSFNTSIEICCMKGEGFEKVCVNKETAQAVDTWGTTQPSDATAVLNDGTSKDSTVRFRVSVTLPGSKFLAGQSIAINGETLGEYIAALYFFVVSAAGILAAGMIFYGGLQWLTAGGKAGSVQDAKDRILSALIGLGLALGAYLILVTISPKLVKFNSLSIRKVESVQQVFNAASEVSAIGYKVGAGQGTVAVSQSWYNQAYNSFNTFVAPQAAANGIDPKLMYAFMLVESSGRANVPPSSAGACGLFQLLPSTAQPYLPEKPNLICADLSDPALNTKAAAAYMKSLFQSTCPTSARKRDGTVVQCDASKTQCKNGDLRYVIAAYNGGQGANCSSVTCPGSTWWECEGNPGYAETRTYVQKVLSAYEQIQTFTP